MRHHRLAMAAIVGILTAICLPFLLTGQKIRRNDDWLHLAARHAVIRKALFEEGQFPLRSHFFQGGYPTLSDPEDPTLNPLTLLSLAFGEAMGLKLTAFAMHLVAGLGMYYLASAVFGYSRLGAAFSALVFSLSTWLPARHHSGNVDEMYAAFLPLVVALLARSTLKPRSFAGLAVVLGLIVMDGKFVLPTMFLFAALWAALHGLRAHEGRLTFHPQPLVRWALLVALTALIGMANILPALDWPTPDSPSTSRSPHLVGDDSRTSSGLRGRGWPWPRMDLTYHGQVYTPDVISAYEPIELLGALTRPVMRQEPLAPSFASVGWIPLILFLASVVLFFKRVVRWVVLLAVFAWLAMAYNAPLDGFRLLAFLPPFDQMHAPNKYFDPVLVFIIALVAGRGFNVLYHRSGLARHSRNPVPSLRRSLGRSLCRLTQVVCVSTKRGDGVNDKVNDEVNGGTPDDLPSPSPGVRHVLAGLLLIAAVLPLAIAAVRLHAGLFTEGVPKVDKAEAFHHVRGAGMPTNTFRTPHSNAYLNVLRHVGTLDSPMPVFLPGRAVPKFLVHPDDRVRDYSQYRGEAWCLEPENKAEVLVMTANRVVVAVNVSRPGTLVVNQNWHKSWRASEGTAASHAGLLAAALPRTGAYQVSFRFAPVSFYVGLAVTLGSLALAVAWAAKQRETRFLPETGFLNLRDLRTRRDRARLAAAILVAALVALGAYARLAKPRLDAERDFGRLRDSGEPGRPETLQRVVERLGGNAMVRAGLGQLFLAQKDYARAADEYQASLRLEPGNPVALRMLGEALAAQKQFAEAIAMTERAADLDPYDAGLFVRLAAYRALTQQPDAAARMLQRAEELADSPAECQKMLLKAFADMNAFGQGIGVYDGLLASGVRLKAEAHHLAGGLHRRLGRLEEAAKCYERAIAADPNYAPAYCDLGNVFLTRNDPDRAIQRFREALMRDPNLIPARLNLAQAYTLKGQHAEAQAELQKARELTPPRRGSP